MPNNPSAQLCINTKEFFKGMGQQFVEIATGKFNGDSAVVQGIATEQVTPEMIAVYLKNMGASGQFDLRSRSETNDWVWEVAA